MEIKFGWGNKADDIPYSVQDYTVSVSSSGEFAGGLGNCVPGNLSLTIEIPPDQKSKPAAEIFKFAKTQHDTAKKEGKGKIVVYEGAEVGQPIQEVIFDKAWITSISTGESRHDDMFALKLTISAASIQLSDVKFEDKRKANLLKE